MIFNSGWYVWLQDCVGSFGTGCCIQHLQQSSSVSLFWYVLLQSTSLMWHSTSYFKSVTFKVGFLMCFGNLFPLMSTKKWVVAIFHDNLYLTKPNTYLKPLTHSLLFLGNNKTYEVETSHTVVPFMLWW